MENLLIGDQRLWAGFNSIHRHQYNRWIGRIKHVGIELEFTENLNFKLVNKLVKDYGHKAPYNIRMSHAQEIQVLWDVTDPIKFVNNVKLFVQVIQSNGLTLIGSVHVNTQVNGIEHFRKCLILHYDMVRPNSKSYYRSTLARCENKKGPSALSYREFISKLLVCILAYDRSKEDQALKMLGYVEHICPQICLMSIRDYANRIIV